MGWFFLILVLYIGFDHIGECIRELRDEIRKVGVDGESTGVTGM